MDQEAFRQRLMQVFLAELQEHLQALERDLLALEQQDAGGRKPLIESLFRSAHTLKGAARAVGSARLEATADALEYLFDQLRGSRTVLSPALLRLLFDTIDAMKTASAVDELGQSRLEAANGPLALHFPALQRAMRQEMSRGHQADTIAVSPQPPEADQSASSSSSAMPAATDPGIPDTAADPLKPIPVEKMVRVSIAHLQHMLALSGELIVARQQLAGSESALTAFIDRLEFEGPASASMLKSQLSQLKALVQPLRADRRRLEQLSVPLQARIRQTGMISFAEACESLPRAVRDLAGDLGKQVELRLAGGEIEIDRAIVDGIKESLLHLVRNALAHGIELPAERLSAGKAAKGSVGVSASLKGGGVAVRITDDGRGLDVGAIKARMAALADAASRAAEISDEEAINHIFHSGFSTQDHVSPIAGRGVGLDVVRTAVAALGGDVAVTTEAGQGTCFELRLPLTLSILSVVLVRCAGQVYAFDTRSVSGLLRISREQFKSADGHDVIVLDDRAVRVFPLCEILQAGALTAGGSGKLNIVLLQQGGTQAAFIVDELLAEQSVAVKSMGSRFRQMQQITGVTVMSNGELALIVSADALIERALREASREMASRITAVPMEHRRRLLIADDSLTTRTLMKGILESENFFVTAAADGRQAWDILQQGFFDLLVSDIEMPGLDGIALTTAIRSSARFRDLPVILVTGLADEQDRLRGMEAGANAYLVKSSFDQSELIRTINQLL